MSLFETLFGIKKPTQPTVGFSTWEDTKPGEADEISGEAQERLANLAFVEPQAPWPFPVGGSAPITTQAELVQITESEEEIAREARRIESERIALHHANAAKARREEKAELKEIVQEAPSHGIEFVHVGRTTFAWRYHNSIDDIGFVNSRRVIDVSSAICNPSDQFAKWHGSAVAARNMFLGKYMTIRISSDAGEPRDAVERLGMATLDYSDRHEVEQNIRAREWAREDRKG